MADIKAALYAVLGRRKLGNPNYEVRPENRGGKQRFRCEVRVPGINYGKNILPPFSGVSREGSGLSPQVHKKGLRFRCCLLQNFG